MGFNPTKTKVQLKLALNRLQLLQQKKTALSQNTRREIGQLLKQSKFESARVRVEHVIREDFLVEALELLQLYVDTLLARFGLVTTLSYRILIRELDAGIAEAVTVLVYAAPRVDIQELSIIREQLIQKYGKDLVEKTTTFAKDHVNPRVFVIH
jgi:vacuolar protein sorting-associated protein IST1